MIEMNVIQAFHAHVYYESSTCEQVSILCHEAGKRFDISIGRMHKQPVGPHPKWSCQLAFKPELFAEVIPWLALNRNGLTVFIHPDTGNDLKDHTEYTMWMGQMEQLNLEIFNSE